MATAFQGEAIVGISSISGSGTLYTVPAGRYAKITIHGCVLVQGESVTVGSHSSQNPFNSVIDCGIVGLNRRQDNGSAPSQNLGGQITGEVILTSGESVSCTGTLNATIREFLNP